MGRNSSHLLYKRLGNGFIPKEILSVLNTEEQSSLVGMESFAVDEALGTGVSS